MDKIAVFNREYGFFKNNKYIDNLKILINMLPDYFFEVPASSTGKYHPKYASGDGGLVRHTKVALLVASSLLNNPTIGDKYTDDEKDMMLFGIMLHDGFKLGKTASKYTVKEHPLLAASFVRDNKEKLTLSDDEIEFIADVIKTHMGPWNKDNFGNEVLEVPDTKYQRFVHLCDFIASLKYLNVEFDGNEVIE